MSPSEIGTLVKNARELKGLSQEDLANAIGVGQSTIGRIENGQFKRMPSELPAICGLLSLPLPSLDGKPANLRSAKLTGDRDFPVYSAAEGGPGEVLIGTDPIDFIPRPIHLLHAKDAYGLLIVGDSMWPEYRSGETAIVEPSLPVVGGENYIFYAEKAGEARASIKHLRRATADKWLVSQWNPKKDFALSKGDWRWAHRVSGKHSRR